MVEFASDRTYIGEDISMIELNVIYYQGLGTVVNKFRSLIEERGVVFICFYHE